MTSSPTPPGSGESLHSDRYQASKVAAVLSCDQEPGPKNGSELDNVPAISPASPLSKSALFVALLHSAILLMPFGLVYGISIILVPMDNALAGYPVLLTPMSNGDLFSNSVLCVCVLLLSPG